jgi:hypothetical protein
MLRVLSIVKYKTDTASRFQQKRKDILMHPSRLFVLIFFLPGISLASEILYVCLVVGIFLLRGRRRY